MLKQSAISFQYFSYSTVSRKTPVCNNLGVILVILFIISSNDNIVLTTVSEYFRQVVMLSFGHFIKCANIKLIYK